jgi:NADH dehydrogenase
VGGHFSNRTPSFLLVPVRVWLGAVWLFEGIMKAVEGWLAEPKLTGFFGGAQSWYDNILNSGAGTTDATSSATEQVGNAATSAGTVIFNFDFFGLFQAFFISGKELEQSTLSDLAFKLDIPVMNWFVNNFILSADTMQVVMQVFIVLAEILIGLALIGGLFTFPASAFSLVLQFMFVTTTGLYLVTFWMIFAAVAVLIGGGSTFGLDYYAIPALKKAWKKVPWVKKSYLFND